MKFQLYSMVSTKLFFCLNSLIGSELSDSYSTIAHRWGRHTIPEWCVLQPDVGLTAEAPHRTLLDDPPPECGKEGKHLTRLLFKGGAGRPDPPTHSPPGRGSDLKKKPAHLASTTQKADEWRVSSKVRHRAAGCRLSWVSVASSWAWKTRGVGGLGLQQKPGSNIGRVQSCRLSPS